jgi:DNA-binding NarL/FixJ family response regulator
MLLPGPLPPGTRTIVLGLEDNPAYAAEARRVGAAGYVVKDRADVELQPAIHALLNGPRLTSLPLSA